MPFTHYFVHSRKCNSTFMQANNTCYHTKCSTHAKAHNTHKILNIHTQTQHYIIFTTYCVPNQSLSVLRYNKYPYLVQPRAFCVRKKNIKNIFFVQHIFKIKKQFRICTVVWFLWYLEDTNGNSEMTMQLGDATQNVSISVNDVQTFFKKCDIFQLLRENVWKNWENVQHHFGFSEFLLFVWQNRRQLQSCALKTLEKAIHTFKEKQEAIPLLN